MIERRVNIVGCGTIGSNICLEICRRRMFESIHLYDFDIVSNHKFIYPYTEEDQYLYKTHCLKKHCVALNQSVPIVCHNSKVETPIKIGFTIDCRDIKHPAIGSIMSVSADGKILYIDCRVKMTRGRTFYLNRPCDIQLLDKFSDSVCNFIQDELYKKKRLFILDFEVEEEEYVEVDS